MKRRSLSKPSMQCVTFLIKVHPTRGVESHKYYSRLKSFDRIQLGFASQAESSEHHFQSWLEHQALNAGDRKSWLEGAIEANSSLLIVILLFVVVSSNTLAFRKRLFIVLKHAIIHHAFFFVITSSWFMFH